MKKGVFILLLFAGLMSCKKEYSSGFVKDNNLQINDTTWSNTFNFQSLAMTITNDLSVSPYVGTISYTSSGIDNDDDIFNINIYRFSIPKNSLMNTITNKPFTNGTISLKLLAVNSNGEFVRNYASTFINNQQYQSIGFYNISISHNDTLLNIKPGSSIHLYIKDSISNALSIKNINILKGNGYDITDNQFQWIPDSIASRNLDYWNSQGTNSQIGYDVTLTGSGWVSLITPNYNPPPTSNSKINVYLPVNFTNNNTFVYAVQQGSKNVSRLIPDFPSRTFTLSNLPYNQNLTIVTVSKIDNQYYLGYLTSDYNVHQSIFQVIPQQITIANLIDYLNTL